jgi:hypothetical protein
MTFITVVLLLLSGLDILLSQAQNALAFSTTNCIFQCESSTIGDDYETWYLIYGSSDSEYVSCNYENLSSPDDADILGCDYNAVSKSSHD